MLQLFDAHSKNIEDLIGKTVKEATYTVHELAELSGVSVRTLHYYDESDLLKPLRRENNYREYGRHEVDRLQQILLYRKIGVALKEIKRLLDDDSFDVDTALLSHLENLRAQQRQVETLIASVEKTLAYREGKKTMQDKEKFEGFKRELIDNNEHKYGAEVREKYGDAEVDASNAKLAGMSEEQWMEAKELEQEIKNVLLEAIESGQGAGSEKAQQVCELHRQWLGFFWKEGMYSKEAHVALGEGYVGDDRFKAYYEEIAPGAAEFLRDALRVYCA